MSSGTDHRKQSLYFPEDMLTEIQQQAERQDRSLSWIVQQAWKLARPDIKKMPSVNDVIAPSAPAPAPTQTSPVSALPPRPAGTGTGGPTR